MTEASREVFGNIPSLVRVLFYSAAAVSIAFFVIGSWLKVSVWIKGRDDPFDSVSKSFFGLARTSFLYFFSRDCLLAKRVMERSRLRGLMLIFVYWGFIILFIGTVIVAIDYDLGLHVLKGGFYLVYSFVLDVAGWLALISLLFYILRRYVFLRHAVVSSWDDAVVLVLMFLIVLSGFCVEGVRLARFNPPSMDWSPAGAVFASAFARLVPGQAALDMLHRVFWIFHALAAFLFIGYIPFSKQFHMFATQIITREAEKRKSRLWEIVHE